MRKTISSLKIFQVCQRKDQQDLSIIFFFSSGTSHMHYIKMTYVVLSLNKMMIDQIYPKDIIDLQDQ